MSVTQVASQATTTESLKARTQSGWDNELMDDRTVTPVVASARTHEFQSSFSHEKTKHVILEEETHDGTGNPLFALNEELEHSNSSFGNDETELDLSQGSRILAQGE